MSFSARWGSPGSSRDAKTTRKVAHGFVERAVRRVRPRVRPLTRASAR
jgi:hypothetical protein